VNRHGQHGFFLSGKIRATPTAESRPALTQTRSYTVHQPLHLWGTRTTKISVDQNIAPHNLLSDALHASRLE
jgi:hypothetical protein